MTVAFSVIESINNPIEKEDFDFIKTCKLKDQFEKVKLGKRLNGQKMTREELEALDE